MVARDRGALMPTLRQSMAVHSNMPSLGSSSLQENPDPVRCNEEVVVTEEESTIIPQQPADHTFGNSFPGLMD